MILPQCATLSSACTSALPHQTSLPSPSPENKFIDFVLKSRFFLVVPLHLVGLLHFVQANLHAEAPLLSPMTAWKNMFLCIKQQKYGRDKIDSDLYTVYPGYQVNGGNTLLLLPFKLWIPSYHFFLLFWQYHEARG